MSATVDQRKMWSGFRQHLGQQYHDEDWQRKAEKHLRDCVPNDEICRQLREGAKQNSNAVTKTCWIFQQMAKKSLHALLSGISDANDQLLESYLRKTNAQRQTPLECAAERGDLAAVFTLYAFGAPVDSKALKSAVESGHPSVFKALICFGANPNRITIPSDSKCSKANREYHDAACAENDPDELKPFARRKQQELVDQSKAAREHGGFWRRCWKRISQQWVSLTLQQSPAAMLPVPAPQQKANTNTCAPNRINNTNGNDRGAHILSLDGGGIRGLVAIQILDALQKRLNPLQKRLGTRNDLSSKFDAFTGTSTGAILALALARGKSTDHCRRLYIRLKDDVFAGPRLYNPEVFESMLKRELGEKTTLGDLEQEKSKRVMVTTTRADVLPLQLMKLCSWENEGKVEEWRGAKDGSITENGYGQPDWKLWKAARCSSAAPTYFPSVDATFVDGGMVLNNPCGEFLSELHELDKAGKSGRALANGCIVSIGTGRNKSKSVELVDLGDLRAGTYGPAGSIKRQVSAFYALKDMVREQIGISDGSIVDAARDLAHAYQAPYFRLQPTLSEAVDLAATDDKLVLEMLWDAQLYAMKNEKLLCEIADLLNG